MTIEIVKVYAAATLAGIQLAVRPPRDAGLLHTLKDRIEFVVTDMKRIVMRLEGLGIIKVQC